jgi:hypothetical protein
MSGLELIIIPLVTGIIGLFDRGLGFLQQRNANKKEKKEAKRKRELENSLILGSRGVQSEWDRYYGLMRSGIGDGNTSL